MWKKLFFIVLVFTSVTFAFANDKEIAIADSLYKTGSSYSECKVYLEKIYSSPSLNNNERAEIAWRLSRIYLILGQQESSKEGKRTIFSKGIEYADKCIELNPKNHNAYMWHSANVGRECQTRNVMTQASKVPVMLGDLTMILDKLKKNDCSEAWQALSEIYYHHPFKSTDGAINFARRAVMTIPSDELRISSYSYFAELLYERNLSIVDRKKMIEGNKVKFESNTKSIVDQYEFYDGHLGLNFIPKWSSKSMSQISDREEAKLIVLYAVSLYKKCTHPTIIDKNDYNELLKLLNKY